LEDVPSSVIDLLKMNRAGIDLFQQTQRRLIGALKNDAALKERVNRLMTIPAVGEVTALTWAVEIDEPSRFPSIDQAISYCGLCSGQNESAEKSYSGPISKQRNRYLQHVLVEAAKLAPRFSPQLAEVHERALERGNGNQNRSRNRATLEVARKLVAYLMAVDRGKRDFVIRAMVT
jgi:transposase